MTFALGLGLIGGGYLLVYSAIRDRSPADVLRQSLTSSGRAPRSGFTAGNAGGVTHTPKGPEHDSGGGGGGGSW